MDSLECLHAQKRKHALLLRSVPQWGLHVVSPVCFSSPFSGNYRPNLAQLCTGDPAGVCIKTPLHPSPPESQGKFRRRKSNRNFQHLLEACSQRHSVGVFGGEAAYLLVHPTSPPSLATPHQPPSTMLTLSFHMGGNDTLYSATVELTNAKYNLAAP